MIKAKYLFFNMIIYSFIAVIIGILIINAENFGILGTNTMEGSCHYSNPTYLNTIWQNEACGLTLESLIILWLLSMILFFIGSIFTFIISKSIENKKHLKLIKWISIFITLLFITTLNYWQNNLLSMITFYKLALGAVVLLMPFLLISFTFSCLIKLKKD